MLQDPASLKSSSLKEEVKVEKAFLKKAGATYKTFWTEIESLLQFSSCQSKKIVEQSPCSFII